MEVQNVFKGKPCNEEKPSWFELFNFLCVQPGYVEFANTVGIAFHFNGSKAKRNNKISGSKLNSVEWTTNIPGMKRVSK